MKLRQISEQKKGQIGQLPMFFQIMMLVVVFAGLTFIVVDKFLDLSYTATTGTRVENETTVVGVTEAGVSLAYNIYKDCSANDVIVVNETDGIWIDPGNYTFVKCTIYTTSGAPVGGWNNSIWNITYTPSWDAETSASNAINSSQTSLYDYAIGFLGIIILVVMVYLIISIVSGRRGGAK